MGAIGRYYPSEGSASSPYLTAYIQSRMVTLRSDKDRESSTERRQVYGRPCTLSLL